MTPEEAKAVLAPVTEALAVVMRASGVRICEWQRRDGATMVVGPLWLAPVTVGEAVVAILGYAAGKDLEAALETLEPGSAAGEEKGR